MIFEAVLDQNLVNNLLLRRAIFVSSADKEIKTLDTARHNELKTLNAAKQRTTLQWTDKEKAEKSASLMSSIYLLARYYKAAIVALRQMNFSIIDLKYVLLSFIN